jgi:hypothetical protein
VGQFGSARDPSFVARPAVSWLSNAQDFEWIEKTRGGKKGDVKGEKTLPALADRGL